MKKIVFALAFVLAIGSAFTTRSSSTVTGYLRNIDNPDPNAPACDAKLECSTVMAPACQFEVSPGNIKDLYGQDLNGNCTIPLFKIQQ